MVSSVNKWLKVTIVILLVVTGAGFSPVSPNTSFGPANHPLFISVTEMEYNTTEKALEISCKVFTDDFEKALAKANDASVDIYHPKDKTVLEKQIAAYISRHLLVKADGKPLSLEYVGYELEEQSTWSYYQVSKLTPAPKKVEVFSNLFYELYDKQINIL